MLRKKSVVHPDRDTFHVGDTLRIISEFDKYIEVVGYEEEIYLEGFEFFMLMALSEIQDTVSVAVGEFELYERVGSVDSIGLLGVTAFPIHFVEDDEMYRFAIDMVLVKTGVFHLSFASGWNRNPPYDHPAVYRCDGVRRSEILPTVYNENLREDRIRKYIISSLHYYDEEDMDRLLRLGSFPFVVLE